MNYHHPIFDAVLLRSRMLVMGLEEI